MGMGTEIPAGSGMEPINIKTPPPPPLPILILFTKTGNSIRPIQPQNASLSLPRVYINNIGADRIVRCVRVMMSTHRSECFDCKSTLDWPNGAEGITGVVRKCSKKAGYFQSIPCDTIHQCNAIKSNFVCGGNELIPDTWWPICFGKEIC